MILNEQRNLSLCRRAPIPSIDTIEASKAKAYRHRLRRRIHMLERSRDKLQSTQSSVQKQFTSLRDLVMEKKHRLYELFALNRLYDEVSDIEEWLWNRTEDALIENTGRDSDECGRLQRDFHEIQQTVIRDGTTDQMVYTSLTTPNLLISNFAIIGQMPSMPDSPERLMRAVITCRQMIALKHSDSPQIAQWLDRLIEDWRELIELLHTRGELLQAAGNRHLFLSRCEVSLINLNKGFNCDKWTDHPRCGDKLFVFVRGLI